MARPIDQLAIRGLTFSERRRFAEAAPILLRPPFGIDQARLAKWRHWLTRAGKNHSGWNEFLADQAISEFELFEIANRAVLNGNGPQWTRTLWKICQALWQTMLPRQAEGQTVADIIKQIAQHARYELSRTLGEHISVAISPAAEGALIDSLVQRLSYSAEYAIDPSNANSLRDTPGLDALRFLEAYPVLARLWAIQVDNWLQLVGDFIQHARQFATSRGGDERTKHHLVRQIKSDLSDVHNGNRTVMRVHFADNSLWYYKPRSGRQEFQWFNLLRLINENGFQAPFKNVKVICSGAHCWMESISHRPCRSRKQVAMYYFRAGAILYLVNLLRGVDFHAGNVIAHACQPVLIDCETLSHPAIRISQRMTRKEEGSVLRTGMLPICDSLSERRNDVSALGPRNLGPHSVLLNGRLASANQFIEETVAGFSAMHVLLRRMSRRSRRFQKIIDSFDQFGCRYIYRPTAQYSWMRKHSLSPSILTNGFDRSLFLHALCRDGLTPQRYVEKEVQSLERGDIPVVYGRGSRSHQYLPDKVMTQSVSLLRKSLLSEGH
jgi:hypothetical protein